MAKERQISQMWVLALVAVVAIVAIIIMFNVGQQDSWVGEAKGGTRTTKTCVDSDKGLNYYVLGSVSGPKPKGFSPSDSCTSSTRLREAYCSNNYGAETYYDCPNGCINGACLICSSGTCIYPSPPWVAINVGELVSIDIRIQNAVDLFGFQAGLNYDSGILQLQGIQEGTFLSNSQQYQTFWLSPDTSTSGVIRNIVGTRIGGMGASGSGILGTITFRAIANGQTSVTLSNVKLADPNSARISVSSLSGTVVVQ